MSSADVKIRLLPLALSKYIEEENKDDHDLEYFLSSILEDEIGPDIRSTIRLNLLQQLPPPLHQSQRHLFLQAYEQTLVEFSKAVRDQINSCPLIAPDHFTDKLQDDLLALLDSWVKKWNVWPEEDFEDRLHKDLPQHDFKDSVNNQPQTESDDSKSENKNIKRPDAAAVLNDIESCPQGTAVNDQHRQRETDSSLRKLWNHLTISRDETSASDLRRELVAIVFRPSLKESGEGKPDESDSTTATSSQLLQRLRRAQLGNYWLQAALTRIEQNRLDIKMTAFKDTQKHLELTNKLQLLIGGALDEEEIHAQKYHEIGVLDDLGALTTLGIQAPVSSSDRDAVEKLMRRITSLEEENQNLKFAQESQARHQHLYFIMTDSGKPPLAYLDEPRWTIGPRGEIVLAAHFPITDTKGYLAQKHDIAFVLAQHYSSATQEAEVRRASQAKQPLPKPTPYSEYIHLESQDMIMAAEEFFARQATFSEDFPRFNIRGPIQAPYVFWSCYRSPEAFKGMSDLHQRLMELLTSWIDENYGKMYDLVTRQQGEGLVSQETMPFLVRPGDVLVWEDKRKLKAVIARSWPRQPPHHTLTHRKKNGTEWNNGLVADKKMTWKWSLDTWGYEYDGQFFRKNQAIEIVFGSNSSGDEEPISSLSAYPLQYAPKRFASILESRGKTFWNCRYKKLVSHGDEAELHRNSERFMVDFETYRQLHANSGLFNTTYPSTKDPKAERMDSEMMRSNDPPLAPNIYVFPNTIPGYNLRSKKWVSIMADLCRLPRLMTLVDLTVDNIQEVIWNKESFDYLVVENETKELVQALVMHQISTEKGTDIIERKGNGLIILLHGGPGTGKTLTAESVAELAEKPLFRVTCGDIGTEPEKVEKYLESVLHLGKIWGCVVLIDEAEVFLEQRSLDNLERNALVSVFLRVLEYYEGILILTSNRVGTFDEAFKSRILLSLHYENLSRSQRTKVWKKFFRRLKDIEDSAATVASTTEPGSLKRKFQDENTGIDFEDIESYIDDLAAEELNGRQIRNVITAGRQYATFKREPMRIHHLKHVIKVSRKFENYLKDLQDGLSDDKIMKSDGVR